MTTDHVFYPPRPPDPEGPVPQLELQRGYFLGTKLAPLYKRLPAALIDWNIPIVGTIVYESVLKTIAPKAYDPAYSDLLLCRAFRWMPLGLFIALLLFMLIIPSDESMGGFGKTPGKYLMGITLAVPMRDERGDYWWVAPSEARCIARFFCHLVDMMCYIGIAKMILSPYNQCFADRWTSMICIDVRHADLMPWDEAQEGGWVVYR